MTYFGNFIGGNDGNVAPSWNFLTNNQTISGKYFVEDDMAYRGALRIGFNSAGAKMMVADRASTATVSYPEVPTLVENSMKMSSTNIGLSGGLEWRKGSGRLQGYYGGELGIAFGSGSTEKYTYANELTLSTATVDVDVDAADDFGGNVGTDIYGNAARTIESNSGSFFGLGIRGFIGAEYFVLPKLSIGGEFGWGLAFTSNGASSITTESEGINGAGNEEIAQITTEGNKSSSFGIDTDSNNTVFGNAGSIRMTFHF
ncbi:MAG: hypothetical protein NXI10_16935 [bacterium]|nr:hypothetical protein [bacterium]